MTPERFDEPDGAVTAVPLLLPKIANISRLPVRSAARLPAKRPSSAWQTATAYRSPSWRSRLRAASGR